MGEIENDKQGEDNLDKPVDDLGNGSENNKPAEDGNDGGAGSDDNNDDDLNDKDKSKSAGEDDDKSQKPTPKADDEEPKVRQRSDFIKERLERKKAKEADNKNDNPDEDEDDGIDPTDKKNFGKIVEDYLKPIVEKDMKAQDEQEISEFLRENPDFKAYEAKARKYMSHPSRKDVPISEIFYGVAGADLLKIGAKRAKIADEEAKKTVSGGSQGAEGGSKSVSEMSKSEIEAKQAEVRKKLADRD